MAAQHGATMAATGMEAMLTATDAQMGEPARPASSAGGMPAAAGTMAPQATVDSQGLGLEAVSPYE